MKIVDPEGKMYYYEIIRKIEREIVIPMGIPMKADDPRLLQYLEDNPNLMKY